MVTRLKSFCIAEMQRRFGGCEFNIRLAAATLLDPRFQKAYFQSPLAVSKAHMYIEDEVKKLMRMDADAVEAAAATAGKPAYVLAPPC